MADARETPVVEATERRGAERSEGPRSAGASTTGRATGGGPPDPQVQAKATRRRFTAEFKLKVLREADRCSKPGETGALLRRHGIYSSLLSVWRREREQAAKDGLARTRGRRKAQVNPLASRVSQLEREKRDVEQRLQRAELIIEIQKKASALLGIPLNSLEDPGSDA
jgi:transposase